MKRRNVIGRELTFGARVPRGWGMAWYEPQRRLAVYFPMPLHWLMRVARELVWRAGLAWRSPSRERHESDEIQRAFRERQRLAEEYATGYLAGWRECVEACIQALAGDPGGWADGEN